MVKAKRESPAAVVRRKRLIGVEDQWIFAVPVETKPYLLSKRGVLISRGGIPFHPASLPVLGLSEGDKQRIRDCSSIMARHLFADKSGEFIHAQVNALLSSLDIDSNIHDKGPMPEKFRELDDYWNKSQGNVIQDAHAAILDEKKTRSVL
ncbi:hypothetical protein RYX36_002547 [Vicia faba]